MRLRIPLLAVALGGLFWVGVVRAQVPAAPPANTVVDGGPSDAGPPGGPSPLSWRFGAVDGGMELELDGGVPVGVDLRVALEPRLADFRVRLLDTASHQVPSTEDVALTAHTEIVIHPEPPLLTGTRYRLVVEPALSDSIRDASGHPYASSELIFRTEGTPPAKPARRSRHRRHHRR